MTIVYLMDSVKMLWQEFGDVPMDPETECIEEEWHGFKKGTAREEIWALVRGYFRCQDSRPPLRESR